MDILSFIKPLLEKDILTIQSSTHWIQTRIYHGNDCLAYYKCKTHLDIAKKIVLDHSASGIYAYFQNSECLYIGISKSLLKRVRDHLQESCGLANENRGKTWNAFFQKHSGELDLYLLPLGETNPEGDALRKIAEILLTIKHNPRFETNKKEYQNQGKVTSSDTYSQKLNEL